MCAHAHKYETVSIFFFFFFVVVVFSKEFRFLNNNAQKNIAQCENWKVNVLGMFCLYGFIHFDEIGE